MTAIGMRHGGKETLDAAAGADTAVDAPLVTARRTVKIAFVICFAITMLLAFERILMFDRFHQSATDMRAVATIRDHILLSDEKLTMSTNMAVMTGDPKWVERYEREVPVMDAWISRALSIAPPDLAQAFDNETRLANDVLVANDRDALQFVEMGDIESARAIMDSRSYGRFKQILQRGVDLFASELQEKAENDLTVMKQLGIIVAASLLVFVGVALLGFYKGLARVLDQTRRAHVDAQETISTLATRDSLTGLLNREHFLQQLGDLIDSDDVDDVALLLFDVDHFKPINERHGPAVADQVLIEIARRLIAFAPDGAPVARVGGDDFAIALPLSSDGLSSVAIAHKVKEAIEVPLTVGGASIHLGVLAGIARYPEDGDDPPAIKRRAQIALNRAKAYRSPPVVLFEDGMEFELNDQARVETELREAIASGQIVPYFQPIVDLTDNRPTSFEVLARWNHPVEGLIPPSSFIPMAERIGQIDALFFRVLDQAAAAAARWAYPASFAVNVTPDQLTRYNLAEQILDTLQRHGLDGSRLVVEITEDAALSDVEQVGETIRDLKSRGVHIALDDFGTGYSSLHNLRALPFDRLKIDRSFVINMDTDPNAESIVQAIVGLGNALGIPIIAEGVETAADAAHLRDLGCRYAQGWHFGKPMPAENAARHLDVALAARNWSGTKPDKPVEEADTAKPSALSA